ncbi:MAG: cell division protein FtsA [Spirochaetaceae bacterium 4572_59]|nr:MAG: cell division protein FtsA [Spirochaetaceae bacterium 4572_59]
MPDNDMIVGLDIGTSTVCAVIAEYNDEGMLQVSGMGMVPSEGLRKGVVVNIEAAQKVIAYAVELAEQDAGRTVHDVYTSVTGGNVEGLNSRGVVAVSGRGREVTSLDIKRVIEAARAIAVPMDREILHVIPQNYMVDDKVGIRNPLDMIGVRLEADVHIITGSIAATQNIIKCINRSGYKVNEISLEALAGGESVLTEDEKELGTLFLDIGGGTTDIVVYYEGAPHYTGSLPVGGDQVTSDMSIVMEQSLDMSEKIKLNQGCCWEPLVDPRAEVLLAGLGGRPPRNFPEIEICRIIQSRMAEIFLLIRKQLDQKGYRNHLGGGIVISGGGGMLQGTAELASDIFNRPVRIGIPSGIKDLPASCRTPVYSTAVGLVLAAQNEEMSFSAETDTAGTGSVRSMWKSVKDWFSNFI